MTIKTFKTSIFLLLLSSIVFGQKYDKKFNENFTTNKDVTIHINASNAEIDVTTWDKNEVLVEAIIEVEGIDKKEADKYLSNWKFEALGNKNKVQIDAKGNGVSYFGKDNFVFFNSDGNHSFKNNFVMELPEMEKIEIPEIDFDNLFNKDFSDIEKMFKEGELKKFKWKEGRHNIVVKSLKEWKEFKKTKAYKQYLKNNKAAKKKLFFNEFRDKKIDKEELKKILEKTKKARKKALENKKKYRIMAIEAKRKALINKRNKVLSNPSNYSFSVNENDLMINNKKVKITKKIVIKVPKSATFNLNTRHCKVKLPKTKASGKVSYGTFKADTLNGGELNVSYSPLTINSLNACTLFLNNVTDAYVASVANTTLNSNSSDLILDTVYKNVEINNKFGDLSINNINDNFEALMVFLNYSNGTINISDIDAIIDVSTRKGKFEFDKKLGEFDKKIKESDDFIRYKRLSKKSDNKLILISNYSNIKLK